MSSTIPQKKLYESLFIMKRIYDSILQIGILMYKHDLVDGRKVGLDPEKTVLYVTLFNHSLLEAASFIEEYEDYFLKSGAEHRDKILAFRKAVAPIMKQVNDWKDLRKFRNEMIAHPWRKKNGDFSFTSLLTYDVPKSFLQLKLLRMYLSIMIRLFELEFPKEIAEMTRYIQTLPHEYKPPMRTAKDFNTIFQKLDALKKVARLPVRAD
jgi:hypothetical protein